MRKPFILHQKLFILYAFFITESCFCFTIKDMSVLFQNLLSYYDFYPLLCNIQIMKHIKASCHVFYQRLLNYRCLLGSAKLWYIYSWIEESEAGRFLHKAISTTSQCECSRCPTFTNKVSFTL